MSELQETVVDPDTNDLQDWQKTDAGLSAIRKMADWISPRLKIRFDFSGEVLQIHYPALAERSFNQINNLLKQERQQADELEALQQYRVSFGVAQLR